VVLIGGAGLTVPTGVCLAAGPALFRALTVLVARCVAGCPMSATAVVLEPTPAMSIRKVDEKTARQLNTGQVIPDVQSVVRELVENSIDADATGMVVWERLSSLMRPWQRLQSCCTTKA
jgi:hypothetical protein